MRLLLDTHVFLWLNQAPDRLGAHYDVVADAATELLLSPASSWELAIKTALGRLSLPDPVELYVPSRMAAAGVASVPIEHHHALLVARLPMHHRDPFDRLLVAQATVLGVPILTADPALEVYDVEVLRVTGA